MNKQQFMTATVAAASLVTGAGTYAEAGDKPGTSDEPIIMTRADKNGIYSARAISQDGQEAIVTSGCFKGPHGFRPVVLVQSRDNGKETPIDNHELFKLGNFRDFCDKRGVVNRVAVAEEAQKALIAYTTYQIGAPLRETRKAAVEPKGANP